MALKDGYKITIEYEGRLDDGTVFDSSKRNGKPLEFEIGAGQIIKGFEEAVKEMKEGDEKEIKIEPKDAYGSPNPDLVKKIPKDKLPPDQEPKVGMIVVLGSPNGGQIPARITAVNKKDVTFDLNHPLAGQTLHFKIKVIGVCKK